VSSPIPIQNIYYLLCYAWGRLDEGELKAVQNVDCETLQDLFAKVLINGTKRLVKRGLNRNYQAKVEEEASLRGRIAFTPSVRQLSWTKGRMVCEFTELSYDTIPNRILKTTMRNLLFTSGISREHKDELRGLLRILHEVSPVRVCQKLFRRIQYHQNLRDYRLLMNICELIHDSLMPTEEAGNSTFRDFIRDSKKMPALFESFVFNFYQHELLGYKVAKSSFEWQEQSGDAEALARLPTMNTDVELEQGNELTVLDCKYYKEAFTSNWETERYKTPNLYQLYSYIMNKQIERPSMKVSGMLLYPEVHQSFTDRFILQGHPITIASINLDQPWEGIDADLKALVIV
tara:strand:- start:1599 stop:2636 length:1038 start_codon:yes stop_codon:yes gene_type:complete